MGFQFICPQFLICFGQVLGKRNFPASELHLYASARSAGKKVRQRPLRMMMDGCVCCLVGRLGRLGVSTDSPIP